MIIEKKTHKICGELVFNELLIFFSQTELCVESFMHVTTYHRFQIVILQS